MSSYNLDEVIDACAKHAWQTREDELRRRGIQTFLQLREEIARVVHNAKTRAFYAQPHLRPGDSISTTAFRREIYDLRPFDDQNKSYGITVILNPNRNETGQVHGGTCYIRRRDQFEALIDQEVSAKLEDSNIENAPEHVTGGRPALLEQDSHRQLIETWEPEMGHQQPPKGEGFIEKLERQQREKGQTLANLVPLSSQHELDLDLD